MRTVVRRTVVVLSAMLVCLAFSGVILAAEKAPAIKAYPLDTCIISGKKLGEMGAPLTFTYKDREIKLCCAGCKAKFDKDPDAYVKKIDEEAAAPTPDVKK